MHMLKREKGELRVLSVSDGKTAQSLPLEDAPAAEGLALAGGRVYLSTRHGILLCFGKE